MHESVVYKRVCQRIRYVLVLSLLLRTLVPFVGYFRARTVGIFYSRDTASYVSPAQELVIHRRFYSSSGSPEVIRTPGYPLLLTIGLSLNRLVLVTIALQTALSCLTVYLVYCIAWILFDREQPAIIAASLYAIEPLSILYSSILLTETLFAMLVAAWVYFLLRYLRSHNLWDLLASGVVVSASAYVRPISYFVPPMLAAGLFAWVLDSRQEKGARMRILAQIAVFLAISMAPLTVWQIRNWSQAGYRGFSGISSVNLYFYRAAAVLAVKCSVPAETMAKSLGYNDDRIYFALHPDQRTWSIARRLNYLHEEAVRILLQNPITYGQISLRGFCRTVFGPGTTEFLEFFEIKRTSWFYWILAALLLIWELPYLLLSVIGLCSKHYERWPVSFVVLSILYYVSIAAGPEGYSRLRTPAMPLISVLAGYGMYLVARILQQRRPHFESLKRSPT
jgi:4-amino-4-deoxy-L-arabinose transferase-like glycosyltransferase